MIRRSIFEEINKHGELIDGCLIWEMVDRTGKTLAQVVRLVIFSHTFIRKMSLIAS